MISAPNLTNFRSTNWILVFSIEFVSIRKLLQSRNAHFSLFWPFFRGWKWYLVTELVYFSARIEFFDLKLVQFGAGIIKIGQKSADLARFPFLVTFYSEKPSKPIQKTGKKWCANFAFVASVPGRIEGTNTQNHISHIYTHHIYQPKVATTTFMYDGYLYRTCTVFCVIK